jgi:Recombination endonuclease VII
MPALSKLYTRKQIDNIRQKLINKYGDKCAICHKPGSDFKKRLSVDHDHKTNKIRGLLCYRCNKFLVGRQTVESATKILNYLLAFSNQTLEEQ